MDIIHGLSNLEIETTHSSSQDEEEEQVKRNWLDLPPDITSLIFMKLGTIGILVSVQWVCTSWWKLSRHPHLFYSIHLEELLTLSDHIAMLYSTFNHLWEGLAREAIDRSCGQLVEFSVKYMATDEFSHCISQKSNSLRCIRLISCYRVTDDGMIEMAKKLPLLEELEIIHCPSFSKDVFETFGCLCPRLCRLNCVSYLSNSLFSGVLAAITQNMPELRYLNLFDNKFLDDDGLKEILDDDGLKEILDGCPHLESLDLRKCSGLKFAGDLKERCGSIKVLRLPNDPTDDFGYELGCYLDGKPNLSADELLRSFYMIVTS